MRKTTIGAPCVCLPGKYYGTYCRYCEANECVQGKEVTLGVRHDAFAWVLVAAFGPVPIGIIVGVILQVTGH